MINLKTKMVLIVEIDDHDEWMHILHFLDWYGRMSPHDPRGESNKLNIDTFWYLKDEANMSAPEVQEAFRVADVDMIRNRYDYVIFTQGDTR